MRAFLDVLKFELRLQLSSPMFAGLALLSFAIHLMTLAQVGIHLSDNEQMAVNSAYLIFRTELVLGLFGMIPAIAFVVASASRDHALETSELVYTTPVPRLSFLAGRFAGGTLAALLVGLAGVLGSLCASLMPWLDPARVAPFDPAPYAAAYALAVAPNLLVFSALAFSLAALTRGPAASFAMVMVVVAGAAALNAMALTGPAWLIYLDPFGALPVERLVRFWTVDELNTVMPTKLLPLNRLIWLSVGAAALAITALRFRLRYAAAGDSRPRPPQAGAPPAAAFQPRPGRFGLSATAAQFASQWRMDLRAVLLSPLFWLIVLLTIASTASQIQSASAALMNVPVHPLSGRMLGFLRYGLLQFVLVVIVYYSGALMHREREQRLHEIVGAAPFPDWTPLLSKTLTLITVLMLVLAASVATCMVWQLMNGVVELQPGVYLFGVFVVSGFHFSMLAVLACLIQALSPGRWSGMVFVTAAMIGLISLAPAGFDHLLYGFRIPFVPWSDMNGFGHYLRPTFSLVAYWGAFSVLLLIAGHMVMPRGTAAGLKARLAGARGRFTPAVGGIALAASVAFAVTGGWIFYNTNILNHYQTPKAALAEQAGYEKLYARYRNLPVPAVTDIDVAVDLWPKARRLRSSGRARLTNTNAAPLANVLISADPRLKLEKLAIDGGAIGLDDRIQGVFLFTLATPLAPGASTTLTWTAQREHRGFVNGEDDNEIVENGSFVPLNDVMPRPVYNSERELTDPGMRKRAGLAPAPRLPELGDPAWRNRLGYGADALATVRVVMSTDPDQIAVAPGVLERQWTDRGRRYFDYRSPIPIPPAISLSSARYEVARERADGVDIEIYYDPRHAWNVPTMLASSRAGLDYFGREFAPYPLPFFRIAEFAGYRTQAQAFAGTIAYSETAGFTSDLRDWAALDYATLHELGHQWWGGMAYGARMQGRQILNEGLAQYSTFLIFKHQKDPVWIRRILRDTHAGYLASRGEESVGERSVIRSEDQGYISYNKAPLALYALQALIGEDKVNQALRAYLAKFAYRSTPFPTSLDLVAELRAVAGPEHQRLITDLFEKIVIYDVATTAVSVRPVGGEYEVTLDVTARQFEADGKGREKAVPLDAPFEVVVFPVSKQPLIAQTPLYQAHHRLRDGSQRVVVRVKTPPGAAGVDPFHLMLDRAPDDNVRRIGR